MTVWVSLLRGINIGKRRVNMPALREALTESGFRDVQTYVQSGNVVADSDHDDPDAVAADVRAVVETMCPNVPVIVRSPDQLRAVLEWCPFRDAADRPTLVHVVHLAGTPEADRVAALLERDWAPDEIVTRGEDVVIRYAEAMHSSKLQYATVLKQLGVDGTARNWRTLQALVDLSG